MKTQLRVRRLMALQELKRKNQQPIKPDDSRAYIEGYNAETGQLQVRSTNGAIMEASPALITDLGLNQRGFLKNGFFA